MTMQENSISRLDRALAGFLGRRAKLDKQDLSRFEKIVAELSNVQHQGHSCIRLDTRDQEIVRASGLVSDRGGYPLILEQDRLYLHRYWHYETRLAKQILQLANSNLPEPSEEAIFDRYFGSVTEQTDWQREAAKSAVNNAFCIITGGPGTGKTTTVVKILAILQELAGQEQQALHIALAAPTGKAAMRLQQSINQSKLLLPCKDEIQQLIPENVSTIHRLLKVKPGSPYFQHDTDNPLPHDLVVIDEASMIDLALMSKLVDALKPGARLILLGDKDQLASVESGAVLADLTSGLPNNTLELKKNHRFDKHIKILADAVNSQQPELAWQILQGEHNNISLLQEDLISYAATHQENFLKQIKAGADFKTIYRSFNTFQILCATRNGKNSVTEINQQLEQHLAGLNLINLAGIWYNGRPVMITQNDPGMHLYNGDTGICLEDSEQHGKLMVFFQDPDGSVKKFLPSRLPHCETVYAMTIHKSQGSEFEQVLIVLPETMNPVLTKELIYTAITRARKTVNLITDKQVFISTVQQRVIRYSGLKEKLEHTAIRFA